MDIDLYKWAVGIHSGIIIALVILILKSNKKDYESKKHILDLEEENTKLKKQLDSSGMFAYMRDEAKKHNIPAASVSSEPTQDDYHAKRKRLI